VVLPTVWPELTVKPVLAMMLSRNPSRERWLR
jgi:hypothetical protein